MSTSSWSFIAGGALFLLALSGLWIGRLLNRPIKERTHETDD